MIAIQQISFLGSRLRAVLISDYSAHISGSGGGCGYICNGGSGGSGGLVAADSSNSVFFVSNAGVTSGDTSSGGRAGGAGYTRFEAKDYERIVGFYLVNLEDFANDLTDDFLNWFSIILFLNFYGRNQVELQPVWFMHSFNPFNTEAYASSNIARN